MYRLHGFFTQNSMKPLYVMEELGVDFEFNFIDLMTGAQRAKEFAAMTPIGKVPVLEHDGEYLFESGAICRYVASIEKSPLFPADKLERARVDQWMTFFTCHPGRWLTLMYFERIVKPLARLGEPDAARCEEAAKFVHQQFKALNGWLSQRTWLANDTLSIAEPFALAYMEQIQPLEMSLNDYPHLQQWFDRVEGRDSVARGRARVQPYMEAVMGS